MYDIYGLGNALVDTEYLVEDSFLRTHGVDKGHMTLVEEEVIYNLSLALDGHEPKRISGGSAANSMYAAQGFGARTFYSCKVAHDEVGEHFLTDLASAGVAVNSNARGDDGVSGRCLILVTPDAERSMNTFLGISSQLSVADIDEAALANSAYYYVEGYLSSNPSSLEAAIACRELAERSSVKTCVSLSDPSMVTFFRDGLEKILGNGVDQLFCNEEEALAWAGTDRLDIALAELKDIARTCNVTLGARGSLCIADGEQKQVPGTPVKAVDTNGAGDIYAGAYLALVAQGAEPVAATRFANYAASQLVTFVGARLHSVEDYAVLKNGFRA
jgi:fructokinase